MRTMTAKLRLGVVTGVVATGLALGMAGPAGAILIHGDVAAGNPDTRFIGNPDISVAVSTELPAGAPRG